MPCSPISGLPCGLYNYSGSRENDGHWLNTDYVGFTCMKTITLLGYISAGLDVRNRLSFNQSARVASRAGVGRRSTTMFFRDKTSASARTLEAKFIETTSPGLALSYQSTRRSIYNGIQRLNYRSTCRKVQVRRGCSGQAIKTLGTLGTYSFVSSGRFQEEHSSLQVPHRLNQVHRGDHTLAGSPYMVSAGELYQCPGIGVIGINRGHLQS